MSDFIRNLLQSAGEYSFHAVWVVVSELWVFDLGDEFFDMLLVFVLIGQVSIASVLGFQTYLILRWYRGQYGFSLLLSALFR